MVLVTTAGLILLTALYIAMVIVVEMKSPVQCLNESCQSESVDNTILNWSSDFLAAFVGLVLAMHLSVCFNPKREIRKSGILAQVFFCGTFLMAGLGNWLYPNSGLDDKKGLLGYGVVWMMEKLFFSISTFATVHFTLSVSEKTKPELKRSFCARSQIVIFLAVLFVLALIGCWTGNVWCFTDNDIQAYEVVDGAEPTNEIHICFQISMYSNMILNLSYALLWIPMGLLLRAASQQHSITVMGLPTPIAAIVAMVVQWTLGSILLVAIFLADFIVFENNSFKAWNAIYGTVLYHWAMMVTMFCLHNLSLGLPLGFEENDEDGGPTPLSWEWWVAMVAGVLPEPKETMMDEITEKEYDNEAMCEDSFENLRSREKSVSFAVDKEISV